jgi:alcohol dehydrogenase
MKAAVVREVGKIAVEELDRPEPGPGEVLVRVAAAGVCHTDVTALAGGLPVPLPAVLGHEGAGVVEAVGAGVSTVAAGDHVVLSITYGCGACFQCQQSAFGLCEVGTPHLLNGTMPDGTRRLRRGSEDVATFLFQSSFAEYAVVPAAFASPVPESIDSRDAAPLTCAGVTTYKAIKVARVAPAETVANFGVGGLGHLALQYACIAAASSSPWTSRTISWRWPPNWAPTTLSMPEPVIRSRPSRPSAVPMSPSRSPPRLPPSTRPSGPCAAVADSSALRCPPTTPR